MSRFGRMLRMGQQTGQTQPCEGDRKMSRSNSVSRRIAACLAAGCAGLALASAANAVDLRDWGRKFPASQRFVVLSQFNNEAVLDKETQLVWQRTPSQTKAISWTQAKTYCTHLAFLGRRGWRLPSLHELASLADPTVPNGSVALPAGHPFQDVPLGGYWSSSHYIDHLGQPSGFAYFVNFAGGGVTGQSTMAGSAYKWCVRGGGPIGEY